MWRWLALGLAACGVDPVSPVPEEAAGGGSAVLDPGAVMEGRDAGAMPEVNVGLDASVADGGARDAGLTLDAGPFDAGASFDAGGSFDGGTRSDAGTFVCTQVNGAAQSRDWFIGGAFEALVGTGKWQRRGSTGVNHWRAPNDPVWSEPLDHPCTSNSAAPDRVVQVIWGHTTFTTDEFEQRLREILAVIRTKLPSVRSIVLQPVAWLPGCSGSFASDQNQRILDAIARVVGGDVSAGPDVRLQACSDIAGLSLDALAPAAARRVAQAHGGFFRP